MQGAGDVHIYIPSDLEKRSVAVSGSFARSWHCTIITWSWNDRSAAPRMAMIPLILVCASQERDLCVVGGPYVCVALGTEGAWDVGRNATSYEHTAVSEHTGIVGVVQKNKSFCD